MLADRYHRRVLRTPREARYVLAHVLDDFRKHAMRLADPRRASSPAIDPASSGRWFAGWTRAPAAGAEHEPAPVAPARSWLLRIGWWRHGRIDPREIPGSRRRSPPTRRRTRLPMQPDHMPPLSPSSNGRLDPASKNRRP